MDQRGYTAYTVTLNPALDCFIEPEQFQAGEINRYGDCAFYPGGKGVNVSLLLKGLGVETKALGFTAGFTGQVLEDLLEQMGCHASFIPLDRGLTRVNIKITPEDGLETGLNGAGPEIPPEALGRLERSLEVLRPGDSLILAGSVPEGMPGDIYARLAAAAPAGVNVVVDTSGPALTEALKAKPFLVKPNLEELGGLFGCTVQPEDALPYARKLQSLGAKNVAVSMGGGGALLLTEGSQVFRRDALPGREVSSVGAGDSFVAGFLYGWRENRSYRTALDWAMAAGAATAFTQGIATGEQVRAQYRRMAK